MNCLSVLSQIRSVCPSIVNLTSNIISDLINDTSQLPFVLIISFSSEKKSNKSWLNSNRNLCSLLDKRVYTLKNNQVEIEKKIFKFRSSIYHLEIDCLELVNNERIFFNNYLKGYCETRNIGLNLPKIIYFMNIEVIHKNSILFLRKLIESNYQSSKFIIETNDTFWAVTQ